MDGAGTHRIDANVVRPKFARHRLGQAENARLRRRVMHAATQSAATLCGNRRHADDGTGAPLAKMRDRGAAHIECAVDMRTHGRLIFFLRDAGDAAGVHDAGHGHENIEVPELAEHLRHGLRTGGRIADIGNETEMGFAQLGGE